MIAQTKRRHVSFYLSLPLVVTILFLLVAQLVAWQRADMIAELADRVAHRDTAEATVAVRQLAAMPRPPLEVLVAAAASADHDVAQEAQLSINDLLRRWQRQIKAERNVHAVARQLAALAALLAEKQNTFLTADHPWLRSTAGKILRLANRIPASHAPWVAADCDAVLAAVTTRSLSTAAFVGTPSLATGQRPATEAGAPLAASKQQALGQAPLEHAFTAAAAPPVTPAETVGSPPHSVQEFGAHGDHGSGDVPASEGSAASADSEWRGDWLHPIFHMLPAMPIDAQRMEPVAPAGMPARSSAQPSSRSERTETAARPLAGVESRELLQQWLVADGTAVFSVEDELTQRGFGRLSTRLVQQLFSDRAEERLRLVDDVLTEPGVDARPWLSLLADDAAADVRLLAVTIMATSNDATLIEKAWQVAISDRDPRIAGLAGRLRERREGAQRR